EVVVAEAAAATGHQDKFLAVACDLKEDRTRLGVLGHRAQRNFEDDIFAVGAGAEAARSGLAGLGHDVLAVLQVEQRPQLTVAPADGIATFSTVSTIGAALRVVLVAMKMHGPRTARTGLAVDL